MPKFFINDEAYFLLPSITIISLPNTSQDVPHFSTADTVSKLLPVPGKYPGLLEQA
jgi:hypothetical protein